MNKAIRILLVEDQMTDAELLLRELRRAGFTPDCHRVETEADFLAGLTTLPDLVLSDYSLPNFDGICAAKLLRERGLDIPFILVSGTLGEEAAVEAMKLGVGDYLLKDRLVRLGPAVEQLLAEKRLRDELRLDEEKLRQQAAALQQSEALFREFAELSPHFTWICRPDGANIYFNQRWVDYTGLSLEESYGHGWNKPFHPEDQQRAWDAWRLSTRHEAQYQLECRLRRHDGQYRWFDIRGVPVRDPDGKIGKWFGTCTDIHDGREAEENLVRLNERFDLATRGAGLGIWDWDVPKNQLIWDDQMYVLFGVNRDDFSGAYDAWASCLHPKDAAGCSADLEQALQGRKNFNREFRVVRPDGEVRHIHAFSHVVRDADGKPLRMTGINYDITERKRSEETARQKDTLIRQAGRLTHMGGWSMETSSGLVLWSDEVCEIMDGPPGSSLALSEALALHPTVSQEKVTAALQACAQNGTPFDLEVEISTIKGRKIWGRLCGEAERNPDGAIYRVQGAFQDITVRKTAEIALSESEDRFRALTDTIPQMIWMARPDGAVDYFNRPMLDFFGRPLEEVVGWGWTNCIHPDDLPRCQERWNHSLSSGNPYFVEFRVLGAIAGYCWHLVQALPMRDSSGRIIRWFGTSTDVMDRKRSEEVLRRSEESFRTTSEQLRKVLDSSLDVICTFDLEGRFTQVSAACKKIWGYLPEELLGRNYLDFVFQEDHPKTLLSASEILAGKPSTHFENRYVRKDGKLAHIMWSASWSEADQSMFCVARDVTEGRWHEEQLRLLETCVARLNDSVVISKVESPSGENGGPLSIVYVNPAFEQLTGYSSSEALGKIPPELLQGPETDRATARRVSQAIKNRQPIRAEIRHYTKAGVAYWGEMNLAPIFSPTGEMTHVVSVERDNTEARQTQERVTEQAALIDQAHDAIFVSDLDHNITFWNKGAEQLYGWTAVEVAGSGLDKLLHDQAAHFQEAERSILLNGEWSGELQKVTRDKTKVTVESRVTLLLDSAGHPKSYLHIDTDITERKKTEQQFLRAQRMDSIGTLAGGIAHDLNNMLAPIMMSLAILRMKFPDAETESLLNTLQTSAERGADLIRQVLSFARGVEGQRLPVNPTQILQDIQKIAHDTFPKSIAFELTALEDLWTITGDPTQIHQVFLNLCVNARDAMPNGGQITVTLGNIVLDQTYAAMNPGSHPGAYVLITVADNGTGIPPDVQDRIFEPFFTTKELGKGTGLGLSTTLGIIKNHQGFISLYSELGQGTKFKIFLPANASETAASEVAIKQTRLPLGDGELILVVDDETAIRDAVRSTLERFGYRVLLAKNGAEAVSFYALRQEEIAAVLTDMAMPIMDGPATIIALQTMNPAVKIIGSSGLTTNDSLAKAMGAGITHFVPKPYTAEILLQKLKDILNE